jgi:ABC-type nitrate/sulfonate/bicarbonate transport system permease component
MRSFAVRIGLPALAIVALLIAWQMAFLAAGLNPMLFPPPTAIAHALVTLFSPTTKNVTPPIITDVGSSAIRLAIAMGIAIVIGPLLGVLMGTDRRVYGALTPVVNVLLPIPPYAYVPIMLLWLGQGEKTIIVTTALGATLPLIYTTTGGVRAIDRRQVWMLKTFDANRITIFRRLIFPAAFAAIVSGLRQSLAQAWRTLIGSEFLAAPMSGLGYLIFNARDFLAVDVMFAGILILSILGFFTIYVLVGWLENRTLVRWGLLTKANV